jgi:hypothetical protein
MRQTRHDEPDPDGIRALARARLREAALTGSATALSPAAMSALLRLAVSPEHADDALVLQQELRLHQIEIELLAEARQGSAAGDP